MNLLNNLKIIRFKENIIRIIPVLMLVISFYFTGELFIEKEELKLKYNDAIKDVQQKEEEPKVIIEEIDVIDTDQLEVLLYIAKEFKYSRVDVVNSIATIEFNDDAFFEARDFEKALENNGYAYNLQLAEGGGSWNGIRIEVSL